MRFGHILDGTSHTLLLGERPPSPDLLYGWWYAGAGQDTSGSLDAQMGIREINRRLHDGSQYNECGRGPFSYAPGLLTDHCATFHNWSTHLGGAHFAFCDGSVRFVAYSADSVLPQLATRAGGEVVALD